MPVNVIRYAVRRTLPWVCYNGTRSIRMSNARSHGVVLLPSWVMVAIQQKHAHG